MRVGIDLGTTNSAVAYIDNNGNPQIIPNSEGDRTTPSVIFFEGNKPIVGQYAKETSVLDPLNVAQFVKRQIGFASYSFEHDSGESYSAEDLSAIILKKLKTDAENALGTDVTEAVITVPAYFNDAQRKATQDAGFIAGLDVLAVINEPTAAALAYGMSKTAGSHNVMVYDLGGGTFDVTIMNINNDEITIKATGGDKNLGGFDFDNYIMNLVMEQFEEQHEIDLMDDDTAMQELREKAESAKKNLSSRNKIIIALMSQGKVVKTEISKEQFESMSKSLLDRTSLIMEMVLEDSGLEWNSIDKILLVGGSTRMPAVQETIRKTSGINPCCEVHPDEVVAIGAAYYAAMLPSEEHKSPVKDKKITDVNSHSLGVAASNEDNEMKNSIILPRNTPLPSSEFREFYTMHDGQDCIELIVTEGEDEELEYVSIIGKAYLKLRKRPKGSPIRIIMGYDTNSIIHVRVIDLIDNTDLGEMDIDRKSNLNNDQINAKKNRISKMEVE